MPAWLELLTVVVFGLCIGSFLNVCAYRLPLGGSIVYPASRCTSCARTLSWFDNVPVLSWAILGGRCRTCKAPVSWMYPSVEIITSLVFVLTYLTYGLTLLSLVRVVFACALIVLFITDLQHKILPNTITLPGIVVGFVCSFFLPMFHYWGDAMSRHLLGPARGDRVVASGRAARVGMRASYHCDAPMTGAA